MRRLRFSHLALVAALALPGCSYTNNVLDWATGTTEPANTGTPTSIPIAPSQGDINKGAVTTTPLAATPAPSTATTGTAPTGSTTIVGMKAQALRTELAQLQGDVASRQQEFATDRQNLATALGQVDSSVAHLGTLSNQAASDASFGTHLLNEVRAAYNSPDSLNTDRDELRQIEAQATTAAAQADQLLNGLSSELVRQGAYVAGERNNLVALSQAIQKGQSAGPSLADHTSATSATAVAPRPATSRPATSRAAAPPSNRAAAAPTGNNERPLVVIRFDQPNVDYEQPLYTAVSSALERKPSATFTIQAVAPNAGSPAEFAVNTNAARQNAENVLRSLTTMGLPADRLSVSATMSPDISSNEVRIFVR